MNYLIELTAFLFGLCVGSFLNVCIWRLPESKSVVRPRSMCPKCGYMIPFYDNIPILSYVWLRGKCRKCGVGISPRYPLVELMSGLFAFCTVIRFGLTPEAAVYYVFISTLIVVTYIDIDHQIIPDMISLPGIPIFFLASFALPDMSAADSLLGLLAGGGSLWLVAWAYNLATGKEGMGGGDIKLLAMIGALIGWRGVFFTIFAASLTGTLVGTAAMLASRKDFKTRIPFGPFLAIGAISYIFMGNALIFWYFGLLDTGNW